MRSGKRRGLLVAALLLSACGKETPPPADCPGGIPDGTLQCVVSNALICIDGAWELVIDCRTIAINGRCTINEDASVTCG